jgi:hypothetical protein
MDERRFDAMTRGVAATASRRGMLRGLVAAIAGAMAGILARGPRDAAARRQACQVRCGADRRFCNARCRRTGGFARECKRECRIWRKQCFRRCDFKPLGRRLARG